MACRGYFLALDDVSLVRVLAQDGDDEKLIEVVQEFDMTDAPDECDVDKAWDGIHRCLTEGALGSEDGAYPLNAVVLGGLPLYQGDDYLVSYNTRDEVREIAAALTNLDRTRFAARYWALDPAEYGSLVDQAGLDYLIYYLDQVTAFYQRAAQVGWATIFVVDQ